MKNVTEAVKYVLKAFFGGCFGCLGVWFTSLIIIGLVVFLAGPAVVSFVQGIELPSLPFFPPGEMPGGPPGEMPGGPPGGPPGLGTPPPMPTGELPRLEIWLTEEDDPDAEPLTTLRLSEAKEVHCWARGPEGASIFFQLWMTLPDGGRDQFGPGFQTEPTGEPVSCGSLPGPPPGPGTYKLEALIGETVVGSTTLEVTP